MFLFVTYIREAVEDILRVAMRPLPILAAALFAGLGLGYLQGLLALLILLVLAIGLAMRCIVTPETRKFWTLVILGFIAGFTLSVQDMAAREREAKAFGGDGIEGEFVCRVAGPVLERRLKSGVVRYSFKAESLAAADGSFVVREIPAQVSATAGRDDVAPGAGEIWRFHGSAWVVRSRYSPLPGVNVIADWRDGAERKGLAADAPTCMMWMEHWRKRAAERATLGIEDWGAVPQLNQAILLGMRGEMPPAMRKVFANSGTIHIFAISGLHIMLIASILILLIAVAGVNRVYWVLPLAPSLVFYTIVTGARPSAVRPRLRERLRRARVRMPGRNWPSPPAARCTTDSGPGAGSPTAVSRWRAAAAGAGPGVRSRAAPPAPRDPGAGAELGCGAAPGRGAPPGSSQRAERPSNTVWHRPHRTLPIASCRSAARTRWTAWQ